MCTVSGHTKLVPFTDPQAPLLPAQAIYSILILESFPSLLLFSFLSSLESVVLIGLPIANPANLRLNTAAGRNILVYKITMCAIEATCDSKKSVRSSG